MIKPINQNIVLKKEQNTPKHGIIYDNSNQNDAAKVIAVSKDIPSNVIINEGMHVLYNKDKCHKLIVDDEEYILINYQDILAILE